MLPEPPSLLIQDLTSEAVMEEAFAWLCRQRKSWPASADVWDFRRHWSQQKASLQRKLRRGTYQLALLMHTSLATGEEVDLWPAREVLAAPSSLR